MSGGDKQKIGDLYKKRKRFCVYENSEGEEVVNQARSRRIMKSTILSWLIDENTVQEYTRVYSVNELTSQLMKSGLIKRCGIQCDCCNEVLSVENFYVHGGRTCDKPYEFILVSSSSRKKISLLECMRRSWNKSSEIKFHECNNIRIPRAKDSYDDTCIICADGGNLICCDKCSSIYHSKCMYMTDLPAGSWFCPYCVCIFCAKPCVEDDVGCPLCAKHYHRKCHEVEYKKLDLNRLPATPPYCQGSWELVDEWAKSMVGRRNDLNEGYSWTLLCRMKDDDKDDDYIKYARLLCHSKLAVARRLMQECFDRIVDRYTKVDVIPSVVYNCGSNFPRVDYTGFYTAILEKDDEVISAASLRIHGTKLAEMPFIATMEEYRGRGMCKRLMAVIELALCSLNVEHLVVPSVAEKVKLWTEQFGFRYLDASVKEEFTQYKTILFHDSVVLQKQLLPGPDGPQDA